MDFGFQSIESRAPRGRGRRILRHDGREFGSQQSGIGSGEEQSNAQAARRELVSMAAGDTLDDATQAETAQVVSHPSGGVIGWIEAQQLRQ